ncbi:DNA polymerase I,DNA polymerase I,DNA polymerase I,DNA polymerase I-3'-5' exonuclease and polymerase domains,DNA polymerase I,DNA polymerase family A [[Clostridium] sordellii]|uniref:DNA polymerase I n=1 Tax=Paraclostridium sordellii TaxID=1505 RepID=UPI000541EE40|nr:DNA polymerase I [Paeniclostridium sordellii]CEK34633.1 DNA polymerase I,DNA polymerase I,DNA polymerase I,DNA polymerase I-3'-5' exonuclease and polymerase domains,DNA polymerase I,DNA polymerase family A [[Clostridium] sordellii] [Paeniclostridium sordellii]
MDKTLVIIDGNSIVNRAFYALPDLTNKQGLHTNAIYGFTTMLFKIIENYKPTHISVAFDKKAPTFRHLEYKEYKAGRKKMPDELREQIEPLKNLLDVFKINRLELEGYEADDIIGTVSLKAEKEGYKVFIVTGDKDAIQLASKTTTTLITKKGVGEVDEFDFDEVMKKYEMTPNQFIDLKGLMGDKSDNIPGVPGIGEVTGIKLIKEFGSIENIIENVDSIKGSSRKKIEEHKDLAIMSKRLATIIRDVPIDITIDDLSFGDYDKANVIEVFNELGFNSLISRIGENSDVESESDNINLSIKELVNIEEFIKDVKSKKSLILKAIRKNGNILEKNLMTIYLSINGEDIYYINEENLDKIRELLISDEIKKYGYELKDDYITLRPYGIFLNNMYFDISIAEYLIDSSSANYTYDSIAMNYFGQKIKSTEELLGKGVKAKKIEELEKEEIDKHIGSIINLVERVNPKMEDKLKSMDMDGLFYHVEMPLVEVLGYMEFEGVMVDKDKLVELGEEFKLSIDKLESEIYLLAGEEFNINSPKQLGVILFEKLELPVIKKTKTGYSTNAEVLERLRDKHEIIDKITEYRQIVKLKSTYVDGLINIINPISHRIHSSFNQTITTTGRISSTEPNLQNIPVRLELGRNIRKVFIANKGCELVDADYSQIELRVLAHMSQDEHMIDAFNHDIDIHTKTASQVFGIDINDVTSEQRSAAKAVNFGIVYGISDFGLSQNLKIPVKEAKTYIDNYLNTYEDIKTYMDNTIEEAKKDGYVKTILNRRRYIPEINSGNVILKNLGKRLAMNAPIQGSAADIIKIAMVNVYKKLEEKNLKSKLILQVHDELIIETCEDEIEIVSKIVKDEMEHAVSMDVNLDVDLNVGKSWYETK